mgnify:CR=1 FL=1
MPTSVVMPKQGNTVESVIIVDWKKRVGETVEVGDVLCEVETDKATMEVPSPVAGVLLKTLYNVGLGYIKLGQSAPTLSGGEAQRVKLAAELAKVATGRTFYILDEPTTGLHFADVAKLLAVLHRLVDAGNTVVVIEHNLDVIKVADYIIDLGPEGGERGGRVIAVGTPEEIAKNKNSYTGIFLKKVLEKEATNYSSLKKA